MIDIQNVQEVSVNFYCVNYIRPDTGYFTVGYPVPPKYHYPFSSLSPEQLDVMVMYEMMGVRMDNKTFQVSQSVSQQQVSIEIFWTSLMLY